MHQTLTRREFTAQSLASLLTASLLETLGRCDAFAAEVRPLTIKWLADVDQLGRDVKGQKISQIAWQKKIEELYSKVDLPDLLKFIEFDKLTHDLKMVDNGARSLRIKFPEVEGLPKDFVFGHQIFALKKGRSVVPHGHNNMATAFLILKGDFQGRNYDRLQDEKEHLILKPTVDKKFVPGGVSTISDDKDNVHWFQALSESAFIFNIHVTNIRPGNTSPTGRVYVDPNGEKLKDGTIRAKLLGYTEAHEMYG
ncbi:MAG: hypothetical protein HZA46_08315 [Planctomycetales bacterium]|nr:hypothetical protein [Planctomycetales bacterium]